MKNFLEIKNLHVSVEGKEILKGVNLSLELGKINVLMGPNGSGKSTLAHVLMGDPKYEIIKGEILLNGEDITNLKPDERAKRGVFLSFQSPTEVSGVTIYNFLKSAMKATNKEFSLLTYKKLIKEKADILGIDEDFFKRYLNEGFSGGEKKKAEILQLLVLNPKMIVLDETDSGLDIDALKTVAKGVNSLDLKEKCVFLITHYKRILEYIRPDKVFIMVGGRIVHEGSGDLVDQLEKKGYGWIVNK